LVVPQGAAVLVAVQVVPVVLVFQEFLEFQVRQVLLAVQAFPVFPEPPVHQVHQDPVVLVVLALAVLAVAAVEPVADRVRLLVVRDRLIVAHDVELLNRRKAHASIARFALLRFVLSTKMVRCLGFSRLSRLCEWPKRKAWI
jgi:hypothetical protein